jgi:hypothetical protein
VAADETLTTAERAELEALRVRVAQLEEERARQVAGAMAAAAAAQHRAYWLDRWHVDLNAWVATRAGSTLRMAMRAVRAPVRGARLAARRLRR